MPTLTVPDVVGAMTARLRASSAVAALAGTRISGVLQDAWEMPTYAVVVSGGRGGRGEVAPATYRDRLDLECYGPDLRTAARLAATVRAALLDELRATGVGFTAAATNVKSVATEGGPIARVDPDTGWPSYVLPVLVTYGGVQS